MEIDKVTYLYLNFGAGKATVAIIPRHSNTAEIGVAFCSPYDQFNRNIGRELSLRRLTDKKDFYVYFERTEYALKQQVRELVNFIVAGQWVSVLDFDTELNTTIYNILTETSQDFNDNEIPMTIHTNVVPHWATKAVLKNNLY